MDNRISSEEGATDALKVELQRAFATPDDDYVFVTAEDVIARNAPNELSRP
jgi:hypothetical protein